MHEVHLDTFWFEIGGLRGLSMSDQDLGFLRLLIYKHTPINVFKADDKYNNGEFRNLCEDRDIKL